MILPSSMFVPGGGAGCVGMVTSCGVKQLDSSPRAGGVALWCAAIEPTSTTKKETKNPKTYVLNRPARRALDGSGLAVVGRGNLEYALG